MFFFNRHYPLLFHHNIGDHISAICIYMIIKVNLILKKNTNIHFYGLKVFLAKNKAAKNNYLI